MSAAPDAMSASICKVDISVRSALPSSVYEAIGRSAGPFRLISPRLSAFSALVLASSVGVSLFAIPVLASKTAPGGLLFALAQHASIAGLLVAARRLERAPQLVALARWRQTRLHLGAQHGQPLNNLVDCTGIEVDVDPDGLGQTGHRQSG
jgi:hypothetical protein